MRNIRLMKKDRHIALVANDPWLLPVEKEIEDRLARFNGTLMEIEKSWGTLGNFADAYNYYGIHYDRKRKGWIYREWAPKARDLYLFGDFNDWQRYTNHMTKNEFGVWELFLMRRYIKKDLLTRVS